MFKNLYNSILNKYNDSSIDIQKKAIMLFNVNISLIIFIIVLTIIITITGRFNYIPLFLFLIGIFSVSLLFMNFMRLESAVNICFTGFAIAITIFKILLEPENQTLFWYIPGSVIIVMVTALLGSKIYQPVIASIIGIIGVLSSIITLSIKGETSYSIEMIDLVVVSIIFALLGVISIFIIQQTRQILIVAKKETKTNIEKYGKLKTITESLGEASEIGEDIIMSTENMLNSISDIDMQMKLIEEYISKLDDRINSYKKNNEKIVSNTKNVKNIINEQASLISETSASVEEMTTSINNITQTTQSKRESINSLIEATNLGEAEMQKAIDSIQKIAQSSTDIMDVIKIIANISEQTNMLAMNASIEAAHAGSAGAGFAVVADEIRTLAEDSNENTKRISDTLKKNVNDINIAKEINNKVGQYFHRINTEVKEVVQSMEEIIISMNQMSGGTTEIMKAVTNLNEMSEKTSDSSKNMEEIVLSNNKDILDIVKMFSENKSKIVSVVDTFKTIIHETEKIREIGNKNISNIEHFKDQINEV